MKNTENDRLPGLQDIETLTPYLPRLYAEGFSPVIQWNGRGSGYAGMSGSPAGPASQPPAPAGNVKVDPRYLSYCQKLIQKYDQNKDGVLVEDEWRSMANDPRAADADKNGQITVQELNGVEIAAAKQRFALGFPEETFFCPKCKKGNKVSKAEFQAAMAAPATTPKPAGVASPKPAAYVPTDAQIAGQAAPPKPFFGAGPSITKRTGKVLVRSLRVRSGHGKEHPVVAGLVKDQKVEVTATWTDGKDTWAQLGPDQWAAVIYDGKAMIDLD